MIRYKYEIHSSRNDTYSMDRPHFHEDVEIMMCTSGEGLFFLEPEIYPLHRGQLFLFGASILHRSVANEAYRSRVLHIAPSLLQSLSTPKTNLAACAERSKIQVTLSEEETVELEKLYTQLQTPCTSGNFGEDMQQLLTLLTFLHKTFCYFATADLKEPEINHDLEKVAPILEYIRAHLSEPLTIDSIASHFFLSKYYLCHIFKPATGFGVMDYVIHCRILRARELLRNGMRVQETGETVGFRNNEHFIRTFKKLTGTSPKRYAKKYLLSDQNKKGESLSA